MNISVASSGKPQKVRITGYSVDAKLQEEILDVPGDGTPVESALVYSQMIVLPDPESLDTVKNDPDTGKTESKE